MRLDKGELRVDRKRISRGVYESKERIRIEVKRDDRKKEERRKILSEAYEEFKRE